MQELMKAMFAASGGMRAQSVRLRLIGENVANAESRATGPGDEPYRRKMVMFKNVLDRESGLDLVQVDKVREDMTPFKQAYEPGHPSADADGYVMRPNVETLIEMMDMREAQRSYEANLNMIRATKTMVRDTLELLR